MTAKKELSRVILVSLSILVVVFSVQSRDRHREIITYRAECRRKCSPPLTSSTEKKVSGCRHLCFKRIAATRRRQLLEQLRRKRVLKKRSPITDCPGSSPLQTVDWFPSVVNVTFGKYDNTNQWFTNISWTPMNDTLGNWTSVLVRFAVMNKSDFGADITCSLYPKSQDDLTINISSYGYRYPDYYFVLKVLGFPYSQGKDAQIMERYEPPCLSTTITSTQSSSTRSFPQSYTSTIKKAVTSTQSSSTGTFPQRYTTIKKAVTSTQSSSTGSFTQSFTTVKNNGPDQIRVYAVVISLGILVGVALVCLLARSLKYSGVCRKKTTLLSQEFKYHAFIIYNQADSLWVVRKLLPLLEAKHHLKCCVHYRDFEPGRPFHDTMAETVYKSYKIIAVLSSSFLKSNYCNYELNLAKYRLLHKADNSLIIIRIDEADSSKLPRTLRKRNFIDYCNLLERPFWEEKLLKFLDLQNANFHSQLVTVVESQDAADSNSTEDFAVPISNSERRVLNRLSSTTSNGTEISLVILPNEENLII